MLASSGLFQLITKPTRVTDTSASLIDHIFASSLSNPVCPGIILNDISDHFMTYCAISLRAKPQSTKQIKYLVRDFNNLKIEDFLCRLDNDMRHFAPFLNDITADNYNFIFNKFLLIVRSAIDFYAPLRQASRRQKRIQSKPWLTKGLLVSIKRKQKLYRSHFMSHDLEKQQFYKQYSNKLNKIKYKAKKSFYVNLFEECFIHNNPRKIWSTINSLLHTKSDNPSSPSKLYINDIVVNNPVELADCFNHHFSEVGTKLANNLSPSSVCAVNDYLTKRVFSSIFLEPVASDEITNIINDLKTNKAGGYDMISCYFIKLSSSILIPFLVSLINASFSLGIFPDDLKIAKVIPLFKKGDTLDINNYRPISLLTCFSKIFEKAIFTRLSNFLDKHSVLIPSQYGFCTNRSSTHAILDIVSTIYDNINNKKYTGMVMLDLTKAFDTVCHKRLLLKLGHYGIRGTAYNLLQSYLSNRFQYVSIVNINSNLRNVKMGVPQGSVLGPLLFLIYINNLQNCMISTPRLFADDTAVLIHANTLTELEIKINRELENVVVWTRKNNLTINPMKSQAMIVSPSLSKTNFAITIKLNSSILQVSNNINYLGVIIDSKLLFKEHILKLKSKLSRAVGIMCKLKHTVPLRILIRLYYAFFHSHLLYGLLVWSATYTSYLQPINILQNKALRIISNKQRWTNSTILYSDLKILKLQDLIKLEIAKFMFSYDNCLLPPIFVNYFLKISQIHSRSTCFSDKNFLYLPRYSTNRLQRSIKFRGVKIWNEIPFHIKTNCCSLKNFALKYKQYILQSYE